MRDLELRMGKSVTKQLMELSQELISFRKELVLAEESTHSVQQHGLVNLETGWS